ncbi:MAG: aminotransferase class I/II-fold pyridoxal phosphate-dependent enzyme [Pseudomonadota bacterium]
MKLKSERYDKRFHPETLALGYAYEAHRSEGSVKPPVFLTSTFEFASAADGKKFFQAAYGLKELPHGEAMGLIYSRVNNPNLEIYEDRMAAWEEMEKAALFSSGMAAISTTALALCRPGDVVLSTMPVYGGTHFLFEHILPEMGIHAEFMPAGCTAHEAMRAAAARFPGKVRMLYIESPANPSLMLTDIQACADLARELSTPERRVYTAVDNTFLGPLFQHPVDFGADIVLYSATKFLGGHSDLVAGLAISDAATMQAIGTYRTILGTMAQPFTAWMLTRSLETLSIRMRRQAKTAQKLAELLFEHPKVTRVIYPSLLDPESPQGKLYREQTTGHGSLISFEVEGGEEAAFKVLDRFEIFRLAVSLGGTESLAEHPMRMTHADVSPEQLANHGVTESMIRISVGLEHLNDLKRDLKQALEIL